MKRNFLFLILKKDHRSFEMNKNFDKAMFSVVSLELKFTKKLKLLKKCSQNDEFFGVHCFVKTDLERRYKRSGQTFIQ